MTRALPLLALMVFSCGDTNEVRAWREHRDQLERRVAELREVEAHSTGGQTAWQDMLRALDLAAYVRDAGLASVHVFSSPGQLRASVESSVEECHAALLALAPARWLLPHWSLRLEGGKCRWEGRTNEVFGALDAALFVPEPRWIDPQPSWRSRGVDQLRTQCAALKSSIAELEARLDASVVAARRPAEVARLIAQLRAAPPPCEVRILERELAQDVRGALLEVTDQKLIHPLDPRGDPRLRGLVSGSPLQPKWCP